MIIRLSFVRHIVLVNDIKLTYNILCMLQLFQASNLGDIEEPKRDLRSRGLCLVPLSCMSYVTSDGGGGGIWPPPNFSGGT